MKRAKRVLLVGIDGCVRQLVEQHIAEGICPNFKRVFESGTKSLNSLCPMPTITPPNWATIATGCYPITHQITDYWRHVPGTSPNAANTEMNFSGERIKAETIWEAAERAGRKSIVVNWPTSYGLNKRFKNSIILGGAGLSCGTIQDNETAVQLGAPYSGGQLFCEELICSSRFHPGGIQGDLQPDAADALACAVTCAHAHQLAKLTGTNAAAAQLHKLAAHSCKTRRSAWAKLAASRNKGDVP